MDRRVTLKKHKELSEVLTNSNSAGGVEIEHVSSVIDSNLLQQNEVTPTPMTVVDTDHIVRRRRKDDKTSVSGSVCASGPKRRNRSLSWTSSVTSTDVTPVSKVNGGKLMKRERHQRRERTKKKRSKKEGNNYLGLLLFSQKS